MWIDGCRVSTTDRLGGGAEKRMTLGDIEPWHRPWMNDPQRQEAYAEVMKEKVRHAETLGRWPANLALVHAPECRQGGTKRVRGNRTDTRPEGDGGRVDKSQWRFRPTEVTKRGFSEPDGLETVQAWVCQPGCPVPLLDAQSGNSESRVGSPRGSAKPGAGWGMTATGAEYNDEGGASRFFPQFSNEAELDAWLLKLMLGPQED